MMLFKNKFRKIKYFYYSSGSVLFRMFSIYEVDFFQKKFSYREEKYGEILKQKTVLLDDNFLLLLKNTLYESGYYNWEDHYINRIMKDGHQWKVVVSYANKEKIVNGSNAKPENFSDFLKVIDLLKEKL